MSERQVGIIIIALTLLCIGVVSAEDNWEWATEDTGYPEEYLITITPWYPTLGYDRPVQVSVHVSHIGDSQIPAWMQEAVGQMHDRPHQTPSRARTYVSGR